MDSAASPSYPATPVDCLLSDLISIAEQSDDEAMYNGQVATQTVESSGFVICSDLATAKEQFPA